MLGKLIKLAIFEAGIVATVYALKNYNKLLEVFDENLCKTHKKEQSTTDGETNTIVNNDKIDAIKTEKSEPNISVKKAPVKRTVKDKQAAAKEEPLNTEEVVPAKAKTIRKKPVAKKDAKTTVKS